jgi:pimeloyl-ACP methyl ester carboxylesterase
MLVMAGQIDPMTPTRNAALVHESLPQSRVVVFGGQGRGPPESDGCQLQIAQAFIDQPDRAPDAICAAGVCSY